VEINNIKSVIYKFMQIEGVEENIWTLEGGKGGEASEDCLVRRLINCTLHQRVIKSRTMRWVGQISRMGDEKCIRNFGRGRGETIQKN
jgi:hypothetical protein